MQVTIQGREFIAEPTGNAILPYIVTGPRGAAWIAVRYSDTPEIMRLASLGGSDLRIRGNRAEMTDADGVLRGGR